MKTKVICLIGASGSGKTTVAKELEKIGYNIIQSYTTRPPREDGEWGHTFIDEGQIAGWSNLDTFKTIDWVDGLGQEVEFKKDNMIAYFNSYNSGHHYFATDEQVIRNMTNIYIVDSKGAEMVHEFYNKSDIEVITIYLQVDREVRKDRLYKRSGVDLDIALNKWLEFKDIYTQENYKNIKTLKDISRRLSKDDKLFQSVKCDYTISNNHSLTDTVNSIRELIER